MAKTQIIRYLDDLDLQKGVETDNAVTIVFSYAGRFYQIDLAQANREKFEKALAPYIDVAEMLPGPVAQTKIAEVRKTAAKVDREQSKEMRAWWHRFAKQAKLPTPQTRGSLPQAVVDAFHEHGGMAPKPK